MNEKYRSRNERQWRKIDIPVWENYFDVAIIVTVLAALLHLCIGA